MQLIVETSTKRVKYSLPDTDTITELSPDENPDFFRPMLAVRGLKDFNIGDLTLSTITIHKDVTDVPDDWIGNKYLYDGTWTEDADYIDPKTVEIDFGPSA
tara:strand:+ start:1093 stop:1395 length:303 start_codon:yes stop_codon:yes gene_type:complete